MKRTLGALTVALVLIPATSPQNTATAGTALTINPAATSHDVQRDVHAIQKKVRVKKVKKGKKYKRVRKYKGVKRYKGVKVVKYKHVYYRPWRRRAYYGNFLAGVTLGTVLAVAVANTAPPPPHSALCWYWSNRARTRGYWDYCG